MRFRFPMPPKDESAQWFVDEVQPHELVLRAHLRNAFPAVRDLDDVVQESYLRMWRARLERPIKSSQAFLFTVARHVALDLVRGMRRSPIDPSVDVTVLQIAEERVAVSDTLGAREKIELLGEAVGALPDRCREIIVLHKIQGLSQRDVATRLGLSERAVENQVARGVRRCEAHFRARGVEFF